MIWICPKCRTELVSAEFVAIVPAPSPVATDDLGLSPTELSAIDGLVEMVSVEAIPVETVVTAVPTKPAAPTSGLICANKHSYDRARQGYVHLLLANQKHSREPGDNSAMIQARHAFLHQGFYQPMAEFLASLMVDHCNHLEPSDGSATFLDLGCGEGYYLEQLFRATTERQRSGDAFYGVDISKPAVKKAAVGFKQLTASSVAGSVCADFAVASTVNLPVADNSVDCCFSVFSPANSQEVQRVLKPGGIWLRVSPGPDHLRQLKNMIYDTVNSHQAPEIETGVELLEEHQVSFEFELTSAAAANNLLAMTPFNWHGNSEAKSKLSEHLPLTMQADFYIQKLALHEIVAEQTLAEPIVDHAEQDLSKQSEIHALSKSQELDARLETNEPQQAAASLEKVTGLAEETIEPPASRENINLWSKAEITAEVKREAKPETDITTDATAPPVHKNAQFNIYKTVKKNVDRD